MNLGAGTISDLKVGGSAVLKAYLGGAEVWSAGGGGWTPPAGLEEWHYGSATEAGGEWTDRSGNGNHASLNLGASIGANGLTGGATNDDYAVISATIPSAQLTYSLCAWIFLDAALSADMGVFGGYGTASIYWLDYLSGPTWRIGANAPVAYGATNGDWRNSWVHCAWVADGGDIEFFLNGVSDGSAAGRAPDIGPGSLELIGRSGSAKNMDNGFIDDAMIFPATAISAADILDIYNNSPGTRKP